MNQRFDEDRAELEAHFAERVQAYIELGETSEQAKLSALAKFGETEAVMRQLRRQRILQSPTLYALVCATGGVGLTYLSKHVAHQPLWITSMIPSLCYALYLVTSPKSKQTGGKRACKIPTLIQSRGRKSRTAS